MTTDDDLQGSIEEELAAAYDASDELDEAEVIEGDEQATEKVLEALQAPDVWPKDKRYREVFEEWGKDPSYRKYQEAVLDLVKDNQAYVTPLEQERAELRRRYEQVNGFAQNITQAISPYQQYIAESGMTPDQFIRQVGGLFTQLRTNPQATIQRLAREANVNLQSQEQEWESPESREIKQIRQEMAREKQRWQAEQRQAAERQMQQIQANNAKEITAFADAVDDQGNKLHPYLDEVQGDMVQLIYGNAAQRRSDPSVPIMGLDEAYARACKLSDKVTQAKSKAEEAQRLAKAAAEAKKAKDSSKRVKSGSSGHSKAPDKSLEDELGELYDAAQAAA